MTPFIFEFGFQTHALFVIFSQLPAFFSQKKINLNFVQEMWIQELPVVVANREAGRIVCSIDCQMLLE